MNFKMNWSNVCQGEIIISYERFTFYYFFMVWIACCKLLNCLLLVSIW